MFRSCSHRLNRLELLAMISSAFTHEVGDDPVPRRRVRISGPIYDDSNVPLLRVEYEDGAAELVSPVALRQFRSLETGGARRVPPARYGGLRTRLRHR